MLRLHPELNLLRHGPVRQGVRLAESALGGTVGPVQEQGADYAAPHYGEGLLGYFLRGADLPAADQRVSPPAVWLLTYSSLQAILEDRAKGGVARGGAGGQRIPREGGEGSRGQGNEIGTDGERRKAQRGGRQRRQR